MVITRPTIGTTMGLRASRLMAHILLDLRKLGVLNVYQVRNTIANKGALSGAESRIQVIVPILIGTV